jgi:hypothetical protein
MTPDAVRAATVARILAGRPVPLVGRLLASSTRAGEVVLLDPTSGGELAASDDRPAFVLSTEDEATDGHIVRQFWDLSRANDAGVPILWNHDANVLLGQWQDLAVADVGGGRALVGRAYFDPDDDLAMKRKGQVKRGILNATSVGWVPGESVRRGELDSADALYREPIDGMCGPEEGLVMGTASKPNHLVEATLTPTPAQQQAVVIERLHRGGARDLDAALRSDAHDPDRLLAYLAHHPRVRAWLNAEIRAAVAAERAALSTPSPTAPRSVSDLFRPKGA